MIKNIIFDLGNVLLNFEPEKYLAELGYQGQLKEKLKNEIFKTKEWLQLDRGTISQAEALKIWQQRNPELEKEIAVVMSEWKKILTVKKDSLEILKLLASKNYDLYVLSNFHQKAFSYVSNKYDFFDYFKGKVISAEVGMLKPEAEIYEYLLNEFNLKAAETLFIDDSKKNIEAALKLGIRVIHFKNAEDLAAELKLYIKD